MRSSTSRLRWSTSCRTSRAAVAASPVSPGSSWRMSVTAVIAVSGVRSSWDTSLANYVLRAGAELVSRETNPAKLLDGGSAREP